MIGILSRPPAAFASRLLLPQRQRRLYSSAAKVSDPLRILFCGSDAFSCESLRALYREHGRNERLVEALDVMVLPAKRTGRGLKQLREVPCKLLAEELGLPIHQRETFRKWDLPRGTNLVIVVSFGLFVPPRILNSTKYGGLNVHPSLLPDLRGPAPIHRAMLRGDAHVGISLQTLDPKAFDHGTVLAQTPAPGLPIPPEASFTDVLNDAAVAGAEMLIQGLRDGVHVPPHKDVGWKGAELAGSELVHASKVTKADSQVDWFTWLSGEQFKRRIRVMGSVWTHVINDRDVSRRVLFLDAEPLRVGQVMSRQHKVEGILVCDSHGDRRVERPVVLDEADGSCFVNIYGNDWIRVTKVKVDGRPEQAAAVGLKGFVR